MQSLPGHFGRSARLCSRDISPAGSQETHKEINSRTGSQDKGKNYPEHRGTGEKLSLWSEFHILCVYEPDILVEIADSSLRDTGDSRGT